MRTDATCPTCGSDVRQTNIGHADPYICDDGTLTPYGYTNGIIQMIQWATPDEVPRSEPMRYRLHNCTTPHP